MTTRILLASAIALSASCTMAHHVDPCDTDPALCADAGTRDSGGPVDSGHDAATADLGGPELYVSARIDPADATIRCDATQTFRFFVTLLDGTERELLPTDWTSELPLLGTIDMHGVFTPRAGCIASGRTHVTASATDVTGHVVTGTGNVVVRIELPATLVGVAAPDDGDTAFGHTTGTGAASPVLYPLDGAVMPNNVLPPDIQWSGGRSGDMYRITIANASISMTAYVAHPGAGFRYDWTPPADLWRFVAENYDSGVDITVDRFDATSSTVVTGAPVNVRLTRSSIAGTVYYWGIIFPNGGGEFDRIQAGTGVRDSIFRGEGCVGCHAVSRDGHWLSGVVGGGSGSEPTKVYDLTGDVNGTPPPTRYGTRSSTFSFGSAFSPDASRLFTVYSAARLLDPATGASVAATGLPDLTQAFYAPDWSPDGSTIVLSHMDVSTATWGHKYTHGDLATIEARPGDDFGAVTLLHDASTLASEPEGGIVDSYSSWSPDSSFIAFQHGNWARTTQGRGDTFADGYTSAAIYLLSRDGTNVMRLDRAVAGTHGSKDFWPTFAPYVSTEPDGTHYMWVAFTSGRRYGNAQVGTAGLDSAAGRQLWVTALNMGPEEISTVVTDPSNVPYWLPGQDTRLENLGARWTGVACGEMDTGCSISSDCCSAYCAPATDGHLACTTPPVAMCQPNYASCGSDADCCTSTVYPEVQCTAHICVPALH